MANEVQRWTKWPSLDRFRAEMDDVFDRFFGDMERRGSGSTMPWSGVETFFKDGKWIARCDLPGVDPKNIDISTAGNMLTIKATRESRKHQQEGGDKGEEVSYARFEHSLTLPRGADLDQIKATCQHGVLELTMPVAPEAVGRRIPIETAAAETKQVEHKADHGKAEDQQIQEHKTQEHKSEEHKAGEHKEEHRSA